MKTISTLSAALGALVLSSAANAALVRYTNIDEFNAATTSRVVDTYFAPANDFISLSNATLNGITYPEFAFMVDPGYAPNLYQWGTGAVLLLDRSATLSFAPTKAFAAGFGTLNPGSNITVTIDGVQTLLSTSAQKNLSFYGWVSDTAFTSVTFSTAADYLILDNVTRAGVPNLPPPTVIPEPGTLALMGLCIAFLTQRRRLTVS